LNETLHHFPRRFSKRIIASTRFSHSLGHNRTHAPLVWARVESVYFDFAGLYPGLIVLPLSSRVIGREISSSPFKLSDCTSRATVARIEGRP
jgi:hypothetical protein